MFEATYGTEDWEIEQREFERSSRVATESESCREYAANAGSERPDGNRPL